MLKNYLKTSFRNLRRKPTYSFLNIAGLAMGIACATLIFLWVEDEFGYDHAFAKRNELYMIRLNMNFGGKISSYTFVPGPMSNAIRGTLPGIRNTSRIRNDRRLFALGDKSIYEEGSFVDSGFFSMMQLPFVKGSGNGAFRQLHSIVLTQKMAIKFFGDADPVGKTLRMNNEQDYTVTGVIRDLPSNVSLRFDWLAPLDNFLATYKGFDPWGNLGLTTFVEVSPGTIIPTLNRQLTELLRPKDKEYTQANCLLWNMNDWHLYSNFTEGKQDGGQIKYVKLFSLIAWIILIIACINFMNLATALAGQRAKEVGVRKTLGALKNSLIVQFITESLVLSFLSVCLASLLVVAFLPGFNILVDKQLEFRPFEPLHLTGLLLIGLVCGLIAGSYPAFHLSSFHPVAVLKGLRNRTPTGANFIRKGLVIAQFSVSVILIVCVVIIYQQVQHVKSRDLGYDKQNLLYMNMQGKMADQFASIRADLLATGSVDEVSMSFSPPLEMWSGTNSSELSWEGNDPTSKIFINWEPVSSEYVATMGLQVKEGRNFYGGEKVDSGTTVINESLAKLMGKAGHLGSVITQADLKFKVVGIVKDFVFGNMYGTATPLLLYRPSENFKAYHSLNVRLKPNSDLSASIEKVQAIIKAYNPGYPFEYKFADEQFDQLFRTEARIGKLAAVFAVLAIFISCLGLFGLAAYTAERRTKEIGIRKVLGASATGMAALLSKEFLQLVVISCLIAFPLAWWVMTRWLADYEYRTVIHWWVFGVAGTAALTIALLTVSFQAIKTALANPVKTLRSE